MTNKHLLKFLIIVLAVLAQSCASTTRVTPVSNVINSGRGGVVYALPETVLDIVVPIDRVTETAPKPPFLDWTEKLFGEKPKIKADKSTYNIGLPAIAASGQPDPSKVFYAQISGGPLSDSSMTLKLDARGVLTSATVESENKTLEFVVSTFEAGAKIGGSFAKFISATEPKSTEEIPVPVREAYQRIKDAIATKSNILTGPGGDVAARLAEINDSIKKDMALFFGSKSKDTWSAQFRVVPRGSAAGNIALFSYSQMGGIAKFEVKPRNRIGEGFQQQQAPAERSVRVTISNITPLVGADVASHRLFTQEKRGLHYNIPAAATVAVYDVKIPAVAGSQNSEDKIKLLTCIQTFAQFGSVGFLPVSTGSHKLHQEITLDGATGALLAVTNSSNAFDPNNINKIGNAAAGVVDALDPKVRAERERDIAKAKYDKLDIEKKTRDLEAAVRADSSTPKTP
jgi:hypothetical protein